MRVGSRNLCLLVTVLVTLMTCPATAHADWIQVDSVPEDIVDVTSDRILFREGHDTFGEGGENLRVKDRGSGVITTVATRPDVIHEARLTPQGALFVAGPPSGQARLYEWQGGTVQDLGIAARPSLKVEGDYAIWTSDTTLFRRALSSGMNVAIGPAAISNADVTSNGDVAYGAGSGDAHEVYRYRDGATEQLTSDPGLVNSDPVTDGINVAYTKRSLCCSNNNGRIAVHLPDGGELVLDSFQDDRWPGLEDYRVEGGWVAFIGSDDAVWTRRPSGSIARVSLPGARQRLKGLNPLGEVLFTLDPLGHLYLGRAGGQVVDLGFAGDLLNIRPGSGDFAIWLDGAWHEAYNGQLSRLDLGPYARPRGASPLRASLTTAYAPCTAPNRTHGPPLAFDSCAPPQKVSQHLTVGTGDSNGKPAKSKGFVRLRPLVGSPATPEDEADVQLSAQVTDVRRAGDLEDYAGELRAEVTVRATDRNNSTTRLSGEVMSIDTTTAPNTVFDDNHGLTTGDRVLVRLYDDDCAGGEWTVTVVDQDNFQLDGSQPCQANLPQGFWYERGELGPSFATTQNFPLAFTIPCNPTADTTVGATCEATLTVESLLPGAILEGGRTLWAIDRIQVFDGGTDGEAGTTADNTLFATQGLFVP